MTDFEIMQCELSSLGDQLRKLGEIQITTVDYFNGLPPKLGYKYIKVSNGYDLAPDYEMADDLLNINYRLLDAGLITNEVFESNTRDLATKGINALFKKVYYAKMKDLCRE